MTTKQSKALADQLFPDLEEQELEEGILSIPAAQRRLITSTVDFAVSTIFEYLESGAIRVPEYQRKYVWTGSKPSRLIESLVIQCPIPVIYLHRAHDETLEVIDGNQRFTSIRRFLKDEYSLKGLTAFPELLGLTFTQLEPRIQRHILNRTLRCIIIEKETHPQIKFDVFERLNSGSVPLSAQELRNGIYHGPFMKRLEKIASRKNFSRLTGLANDQRMKREELVLRFFALSEGWRAYEKPLGTFLNRYADLNRTASEDRMNGLSASFERVVALAEELFGDAAFRLEAKTKDGKSVKKFNAAYFDAVAVGINEWQRGLKGEITKASRTAIAKRVERLSTDEDFLKQVLRATSDEAAVKGRIRAFANALKGS